MAYELRPIVKPYYDGLKEGKILGMKCTDCGDVNFPPLPSCQACGGYHTEWVEMPHEIVIDEIRWEDSSVGGDYTWRKGNMFFKTKMQEERYCASVGHFEIEGGHQFHVALYGPTEENHRALEAMLPITVDVKFIEHTQDFLAVGAQVRQAELDKANA